MSFLPPDPDKKDWEMLGFEVVFYVMLAVVIVAVAVA